MESQTNGSKEALFFFRRWLRHPLQLGAVIPSSKALTRLVSKHAMQDKNSIIVELGGGTGCLTRSLLEAGVPHDRLFVIELDLELCAYLRKQIPSVQVIQGNAGDLPSLIPSEFVGKVSTVISGLPMTNMSEGVQRKIINAAFKVMDGNGRLLQYTYRPVSPLSATRLGLVKQRVGLIFRNLPPATVWQYQRAA